MKHKSKLSETHGRPSKKTKETVAKLLDVIRAGNCYRTAYTLAGIDQRTFERWRIADAAFAAQVKKAEEEAVARNVLIIQKAAQTTWTAAAWWLERKYPSEWARQEKFEHTGKDGAPLSITFACAQPPWAPSGKGNGHAPKE